MRLSADYSADMEQFESALPSDYKKQNGIFYTDLALAERILREAGVRRNSVLFDPCCGAGSFLAAAQRMGIKQIFGADLDEGAVSFCSAHLKTARVKCLDTLGKRGTAVLAALNLPEKADVVAGNPPYVPMAGNVCIHTEDSRFLDEVVSSGKNLFLAALIRSFELVKDGGTVCYIVPKNFLHVASYCLLRQKILREKSIVSIVDLGVCFKKVRGEQVVLTVKNERPSSRHTIILKRFCGTEFQRLTRIPQSFYRDEIILFDSREEAKIYRRLSGRHSPLKSVALPISRGRSTCGNAVCGKNIRKFGYRDRKTPTEGNRILIQNIYSTEAGVIAAFGGTLEAGQTVTVLVPRERRRCRYILGLLHSRLINFYLYKFCYNSSTLTMHTDAGYLGRIPYAKGNPQQSKELIRLTAEIENAEYLSEQWRVKLEALNRLVYQIYRISEEDAAYIDASVQKIQSKRWSNGG